MPNATQTAAILPPLSLPSESGSGACDPARGAASGVSRGSSFGDSLRAAFNLPSIVTTREVNERLAMAVRLRGYQAPSELDTALVKRALGQSDASDEGIVSLVLNVADRAVAAENRALLSRGGNEAAKHWAAADDCRRAGGIPAVFWQGVERRTRL